MVRRRVGPLGVMAAMSAMGAAGGAEAASPWNRDAGQGLTVSRLGYYAAEAAGEAGARRFEQTTSELYVEFGVTERLMAGGKLTYAWQDVEGPANADALSGFAEGSVFVQGQLARWDGGALGVMAGYAMPTETVSRLGSDRAFARDAHAGVSVLLGLNEGPAFLAARMGHETSLGEDADLLRTEATMGLHLPMGAMAMVEVLDTRAVTDAGLGGVDYDLTQVAPSLVLRLTGRMRMQVGATFDVAGRDVDLGTGGFVALWVGE